MAIRKTLSAYLCKLTYRLSRRAWAGGAAEGGYLALR